MQSVRRQLKRGNAVFTFNNVTKGIDIIQKRNTPTKLWHESVRNRLPATEQQYFESVTVPLSKDEIFKSKGINVYRKPKN